MTGDAGRSLAPASQAGGSSEAAVAGAPYGALTHQLLRWIRGHPELSVVGSALAAVVSFIGSRYYDGYYGFFLVGGGHIEVSFRQALVVSLLAGTLTLAMLYSIYGAGASRVTTFGEAFRGNLPLLVILVLIAVCVIDFYMRNVEALAAYTTGHSLAGVSAEQIRQADVEVIRLLRRIIVLAPLPAAALVILVASWKRRSLSAWLTQGSLLWRGGFLLAYAVLVTIGIGIFGRTVAFLDFVGALEKPRVRIVLNDGGTYLPDRNLILLGGDPQAWIVTARAEPKSMEVRTWFVSREAVRVLQLEESGATVTELMQYFR